jgi:hypothetical protein
MTVVFESTGSHLLSGEDEKTGFVIESPPRTGVPSVPLGKASPGEAGIERVSPVVGAHDLADVGRRGVGVRQGTGIHQGDRVTSKPKFERGACSEDSGADDQDIGGFHP